MKNYIESRGTKWQHDRTETERRSRIAHFLRRFGFEPITDWTPKGKVDAEINHGRWIVHCPVEGCSSAEFADPEWPVFVCSGGCGYGPLTVVFPKSRESIEAELLKRQAPATRNWRRGETVADLQKERKAL